MSLANGETSQTYYNIARNTSLKRCFTGNGGYQL